MWFASIWIFTLRLPWELGADLFLRHLLDGDPASNTLSWRWVGGLQTPGKHYLARAENIARWTGGRFDPRGELDEAASPLPSEPLPPPRPFPPREAPPKAAAALLLHEDDLGIETLDTGPAQIVAIGGLAVPEARSPLLVAPRLAQHLGGVLTDGLDRGAARFGTAPERLSPDAVAEWAERAGVRVVLTPEAPAGWTADALGPIGTELGARGIRLQRLRRDWDDACWPLATRGFFQFREHIPQIARRLAA
jgi:deoxyribodipyrimidine photo-lyase